MGTASRCQSRPSPIPTSTPTTIRNALPATPARSWAIIARKRAAALSCNTLYFARSPQSHFSSYFPILPHNNVINRNVFLRLASFQYFSKRLDAFLNFYNFGNRTFNPISKIFLCFLSIYNSILYIYTRIHHKYCVSAATRVNNFKIKNGFIDFDIAQISYGMYLNRNKTFCLQLSREL